MVGSTPYPNALFIQRMTRTLVFADHEPLTHHRVLICDRDAKWSPAVRGHLHDAGRRVVHLPISLPGHSRGSTALEQP